MERLDDCDLAAVLAGEASAWHTFHACAKALMGAVAGRALGKNGAAMDDVVQDCFVRLCHDDFASLRRFDPGRGRLSTWLGAVAAHAAADVLRRQDPAHEALDTIDEYELPSATERNWRLELPPNLLTPRQALVLTLLFEDDLDPKEAAQFLKVSTQTVRSIKHQALERLRAAHGNAPAQGGKQ